MKITVMNPFTIDRDSHSLSHSLDGFEPTLTVQADKESVDINHIVRQYGLTHMLPLSSKLPQFEDYTDAPNDYHSALNYIRDADSAFMEMPAHIRARFGNDSGAFIDFLENEDNLQEAYDLGILDRPASFGVDDSPAVDPETSVPSSTPKGAESGAE